MEVSVGTTSDRLCLLRHRQSFRGTWPPKEISLEGVAAIASEEFPMCFGLNPLGNDIQTQALPHGHDGAGYRGAVGVGEYVAHKGLVDLQLAQGKLLQVGERGIAGA